MSYTSGTVVRPVPPTPSPLITQWVMTVLMALGTGVGLRQALGPTLAALVGGSAGVLASYLVDWIRVLSYDGVDRLANMTGFQGSVGKWLSYWLYNPKGIRGTVIATTLLVGALAAAGVDWVSGKPLSMAVASAWAFIGSQVAHLRSLPSQPATLPAPDAIPQHGNVADLRGQLQRATPGSGEYYGLLAALFEAEKQQAAQQASRAEASERKADIEVPTVGSDQSAEPAAREIKVIATSEEFAPYLAANDIPFTKKEPTPPNSEAGSDSTTNNG